MCPPKVSMRVRDVRCRRGLRGREPGVGGACRRPRRAGPEGAGPESCPDDPGTWGAQRSTEAWGCTGRPWLGCEVVKSRTYALPLLKACVLSRYQDGVKCRRTGRLGRLCLVRSCGPGQKTNCRAPRIVIQIDTHASHRDSQCRLWLAERLQLRGLPSTVGSSLQQQGAVSLSGAIRRVFCPPFLYLPARYIPSLLE